MMGISWVELMTIALVALIVIGPKDLPVALAMLGRSIRAVNRAARDFQREVDHMLREAEVDAMRRDIEKTARGADIALDQPRTPRSRAAGKSFSSRRAAAPPAEPPRAIAPKEEARAELRSG